MQLSLRFDFKVNECKMKQFVVIALCCLVVLSACTKNEKIADQQATAIKWSVEMAAKIYSGIDTNKYWIDFSKASYFNKQKLNDFLSANPRFKEINSDSLLKNDSVWIKKQHLDNLLVRFVNVTPLEQDSSLLVEVNAIKSADSSSAIEIIFEKAGNDFRIKSTKIKSVE